MIININQDFRNTLYRHIFVDIGWLVCYSYIQNADMAQWLRHCVYIATEKSITGSSPVICTNLGIVF